MKLYLIFILLGLILSYGFLANGQGCGPQGDGSYVLCEEIPGFLEKEGGRVEDIADFIAKAFRYALMIGGIVVFLRILYGGTMYALSGGDPGKTNDARDIIIQAIWGLALLMGSYLILYTVNPDLVRLRLPSAKQITEKLSVKAIDQANFQELQKRYAEALKREEEERIALNLKGGRSQEEAFAQAKLKSLELQRELNDIKISTLEKRIGDYKKGVGVYAPGYLTLKGFVLGKESIELQALGSEPASDPKYSNAFEELQGLRTENENIGVSSRRFFEQYKGPSP